MTIHVAEFGVGQCISYREVGARRFHSMGTYCRKWSGTASGHRGRAARGPGPIRAPDLGDDALLWGGPPPRTAGFIKGGWRSRSLSLSLSDALDLQLAFSSHSPATPPSSPSVIAATPPPLLRPHVAYSTHPPGPAYHSAHLLLTPPSPPKSLPSRPTAASCSLDRRQLHEVPRSKKRHASCQEGIAQWGIPPKSIGGAIGQSCKVFRDR